MIATQTVANFDEIHKWHNPNTTEMKQYHTVTHKEYEQFKHYWILDALKGWRYGQAFCKRFGINNSSPLYHFKSQDICERWIRDNYLMK